MLNAVSLVAALVGNASLLLNMARRVAFAVAQPVTISGFLLAGVLLLADVAAVGGAPHYGITRPEARPDARHALTGAFYFAVWAGGIYVILAVLMCWTVYGAHRMHYRRDFRLTAAQRTLMLQTMGFVAYLLLGALVFGKMEGWGYVDAVYWADVTLLTVGFGELAPSTRASRGLLFPFAIGGIVMVGLVIGSIRSLVLEHGEQKMAARFVEKRRMAAIDSVDAHRRTIQISAFAQADFSTDPSLSCAQRREQEFHVMRKVQEAAQRERRWLALAMSGSFALLLWFVGAAVFQQTEHRQQWTYFQSLYFSYVALLTIGYGDFTVTSPSGKAFFVLWSLLAVPSLTILISHMGDTVVKWFADITLTVGALTVLPEDRGLRASFAHAWASCQHWTHNIMADLPLPGRPPVTRQPRMSRAAYQRWLHDRLTEHLQPHLSAADKTAAAADVERDAQFYHYVLAREVRAVQRLLGASPPKQFEWHEWEYYLRLTGNGSGDEHRAGAPPPAADGDDDAPRATDGNVDRETSLRRRHGRPARAGEPVSRDWSWLSMDSPLMSQRSEAEWVLDRLTMALVRELDGWREGRRRRPPVGLADARREVGVEGEKRDAEASGRRGDVEGGEGKV